MAGSEPLTVAPEETLDVVAARMVDHGVTHAIVAGAPGETPAGLVSTLDVVGVLGIDAL
jgi:CBS domain-containing protein